MTRIIGPILMIALAGCGGDVVTLDNQGAVCLSTTTDFPEGGQQFEADSTLYAIVTFATCLSSSCSSDRTAECQVAVQGDRIVITSRGSYTDESGPGQACTTDCLYLEATCETGPLPAGEYTIIYGEDELPLTIPGITGAYCVPERPAR